MENIFFEEIKFQPISFSNSKRTSCSVQRFRGVERARDNSHRRVSRTKTAQE